MLHPSRPFTFFPPPPIFSMAPRLLDVQEEPDSPAHDSVVMRQTLRIVKDPIHDYITLHPKISAVIDTKQFQRLRYIKQLGTSYYVWPGASHNRFEHCLGVAHLARLMVEHLQKSQPELGITNRDVQCVEIAGLCHDLGHGPWSHVWDSLFIPIALKNKKWKHEDASEMMFDDLVKQNEVDISPEDANFVKALIAGESNRCPLEKVFLFDIVANKRNGIDVDKFDYIARDSHSIGEKGNLSLSRLIHSARVIDSQICYDIKDANQLYELCYTRFSLHKRIYNHKTAKAIEYMIIDAILEAEPTMKIAEQVDKPEKYVYLTDDIMQRIEMTTNPELANSRAIFDRIRSRDLYKMVDYKVLGWEYKDICREHITPQRIADSINAMPANQKALKVPANDIIVDLSPMHYGMQDKNPLDFIHFYSKNHPNTCATPGPGDVSMLMPAVFGEVLLRVYTRNPKFFGLVQAGYRDVLQSMPEPNINEGLTTPKLASQELPSTPRGQSRNASFGTAGTMTRENTPKPGATPFSRSNNSFTTVPVNHVPTSPTQNHKKLRVKRSRDASGDAEENSSGSVKRKRPL